jgi:hypothetical protein
MVGLNLPPRTGALSPRQGVVANTLNLFRSGAVGFIDWLCSPIVGPNEFWTDNEETSGNWRIVYIRAYEPASHRREGGSMTAGQIMWAIIFCRKAIYEKEIHFSIRLL